ncbi:MAG: molybdopterin-dependent oxidoreductase [Roseibacillus sp.]|jgi:NADH-quinone oxidoreductase subunit G|nr:molybdopterin-dependent oxidoreductase [Roseibacillus sp.]
MADSAPATADKLPKVLAAEKGMVNVQIDGTWIQVPRGTRMIEACKQAEQEVPHYCYHTKLSSPGNCRMCLVQMGMPSRPAPGHHISFGDDGFQKIGWMPRPVISCANTVAENMGIRTSGALVEECRNGVMEFLLINHPLDCPICDQAGECSLQEFSVDHGRGSSRFEEVKVKKPKNVEIGPRIRLDDERCIMCSRCIRFMDEVVDDPVLGFIDRGTHTKLTVHPGRQLDSNYSLNTVDICPVGALTSNDFRFQMRVWFLKETKSIDVNCGTGCNTVIWTRGNEVFRITPRENNDVNSCWIPDSHRLNFHYLHAETRLDAPMIRKGQNHENADWFDAIAKAAEGLKGHQRGEVAIIGSGRQTNEELYLLKRLAETLETDLLTLVPRFEESDGRLVSADRNPNTNGAKLLWATDDPYAKLDAIREGVSGRKIKAIVVFYEDLLGAAAFKATDLEKLELLVSNHLLPNGTAKASHVVMPGAGFAEKRGSMVNITGRLQRLNQAILPPEGVMDDWEIIRDLVAALDHNEPARHLIEDVFTEIVDDVEELEELTLSKIGDLGIQVTETGETIPLIETERGEIVG